MYYFSTAFCFLSAGIGFNSVPLMAIGATWSVVGMLVSFLPDLDEEN